MIGMRYFQLGVGCADATLTGTTYLEQKHNLENIKLGDIDETNVHVLKYRNKIG
jgi:hypothetical protein